MKPRNRVFFAPSIVLTFTSVLTSAALAASGTWTGTVNPELWSNTANWSGGIVADGSGNTADFSTIDLPAGNFTVNLDTARTIGNLTFGDTDPLTAGSWTVANNAVAGNILTLAGTPVLTANVGASITGVIGGTVGYTKQGTGTLTLTANNLTTLSGPLLLKAGTLALGGAQANNQNALGSTTGTVTFEGGTLSLNGSGSADNATGWGTLANPIVVASGQTGTVTAAPRGLMSSTVTGAGTLNTNVRASRWDFNGNWAGFTGTLNISSLVGGGDFRIAGGTTFNASMKVNIATAGVTQTYNPPNNAVGTTHIIGELSGTTAAFLGGNPVNGRFVNWQIGALNTDSEFAGVVANSAGAARIYKVGIGKLTLSGTNTYTGDTQVNAGTLSIGKGGATGSLAATNVIVASGATLIFNRDTTTASTYPGILSGAGSVIKRGSGQVNFTGVNTYTAGTTLDGGTIGITSASSLGDPAGAVNMNVANAGIEAQTAGIVSSRNFTVGSGVTATFSTSLATASYTINGVISGAGSVNLTGSGLIALGGANTYAGDTILSSGILAAANTTGSATSTGSLTVGTATLGGTGTISGAVALGSTATLKPGAVTTTTTAVGTLTAGSLALTGGTSIKAEFASVSSYDKIVVTNTNGLTSTASLANPVLVDLNVENTVSKWTTLGTYNLIQFAGTFTGNANELFKVPAGSQQPGLTYTFSVIGNNIVLTIAGSPPSIWNVDSDGLWSVAGNWLNGIPNAASVTAELGLVITAPRTITLDSNRTVGALSYNNANAYTIAGASTLTLNQTVGNAQANITLGNHVISAPVSLTKPLDVFMGHSTDSLTLSGIVSGAGGINKISSGNLSLTGNNSFLGNVAFSNGTLDFANGGLGAGNLSLDNASLVWDAGNTQDITTGHTVSFGSLPITFSMNNNVTLANSFGAAATAAFTKAGTGNLTVAANTTFTGNVNVLDGTLTLGSGGTAGSVAGNVALTAATSKLVLNRSDAITVANVITGLGTLDHPGAGAVTLTGANTFSGATTIGAGSIILGNTLALSGSTLRYNSLGGNLAFGTQTAVTLGGLADGPGGTKNIVLQNDSAAAVALTVGGNNEATAYSGNFSGLGSLVKAGTGTLTLSGNNTHSGGTTVGIAGGPNVGIVELVNAGHIDSSFLTVTQGGTFNLVDGTVTTTGNINVDPTNSGPAYFNQTAGTITVTGAFNMIANRSQGNSIILNGGTMSAASMSIGRSGANFATEPLAGSAGDGLYVNGGAATVTGALNIGAALAATNSSANTRIDGGSLTVGGPVTVGLNNGGRWSVLDVSGGTFTCADTATGILMGGLFNGNATFIVRGGEATVERIQLGQGTIGSTHSVRTSGSGVLYVGSGGIVIGDATSVGVIRLSGGVLAAKADWSTSVPVELSASTSIKAEDSAAAGHTITIASAIIGAGDLTKTGAGTLILSGTGSYTGVTTVSAGKLQVDGNNSAAAEVINVNSGGTLGGNGSLGGAVTVDGSIAPGASTGTLTVASATFNAGSSLDIELNDASTPKNDKLVLTGALDITAGKLKILATGVPAQPVYVIAHYGSLTGTFASIDNLPVGATINYAYNNGVDSNNIAIINSTTSAYATWASGFGSGFNNTNNGATQDPDNDGISNVLEFVLGGNPLTSSSSKLPTAAIVGSNYVFTFKRSDASESEVTLMFQYGTNLTGWTPVVIGASTASSGPEVIVTENAAADDDITVTIPKGANTKLFGRLQAVK